MDYDEIRAWLHELSERDQRQAVAAVAKLVALFPARLVDAQRKGVADPWLSVTCGFVGNIITVIAPSYTAKCSDSAGLWQVYCERIAPFACGAAMMALETELGGASLAPDVLAGAELFRGERRAENGKSPGVAVAMMLQHLWRNCEAQFFERLAMQPVIPPKAKRGRPAIPADRKNSALAAKKAGKGNQALAKILYSTDTPTTSQRNSVPTILKHYTSTSKK